jgi:hypothetical protein
MQMLVANTVCQLAQNTRLHEKIGVILKIINN